MLYIVATPIGNLEDITYRAVETLKSVDKIYCEDTRRTKILCQKYDIETGLESFHQHSEGKIARIIEQLESGADIAYVSDAGTPAIQDPGGKLVEQVRQSGIKIVPVPGPSAVTALLSVAGISADKFCFAGYVPTKKGRQTFIKEILNSSVPAVFFETAPRFIKLLDQLEELGGSGRTLIVGRELTKQFEEIIAGRVNELRDIRLQGEFVVVILPSKE